jgi:hypothetical protein
MLIEESRKSKPNKFKLEFKYYFRPERCKIKQILLYFTETHVERSHGYCCMNIYSSVLFRQFCRKEKVWVMNVWHATGTSGKENCNTIAFSWLCTQQLHNMLSDASQAYEYIC